MTDRACAARRVHDRACAALRALGADPELIERRGLPLFDDASELTVAHVSASGREHFLVREAAGAWIAMRAAAEADGVTLLMISGFRSFEHQLELVRARVERGEDIDEVLAVLAPPGCSEHHSGRAVDVGTPGSEPLSERFEETEAFRWLREHAAEHAFSLSFPRGNPYRYLYEPWHWCWHAP